MIPLKLELTNFLSYRDTAVLNFNGIHLACTLLAQMHDELREKAASIKDETVRQQFLTNVATNQAILTIWKSRNSP
jgi:hypothetical protein